MFSKFTLEPDLPNPAARLNNDVAGAVDWDEDVAAAPKLNNPPGAGVEEEDEEEEEAGAGVEVVNFVSSCGLNSPVEAAVFC